MIAGEAILVKVLYLPISFLADMTQVVDDASVVVPNPNHFYCHIETLVPLSIILKFLSNLTGTNDPLGL